MASTSEKIAKRAHARAQARAQAKGMGSLGAPCPPKPPQPEDALYECIQALQQILKDTLQISEPVPWVHPPFRARTVSKHVRVILSVTAGVDAAVNAAGLALQAALTVPGTPPYVPALVEMDAASDYQTIFEYVAPTNITTRFSSWGVTVNNVAPEGVVFKVNGGTLAAGPPDAPDPLLGSSDVPGHQPLFVLVQGKQSFALQAVLRDVTSSPAVIDFGIQGWNWPVRNDVDSPEGVIPRTGYGLDCR